MSYTVTKLKAEGESWKKNIFNNLNWKSLKQTAINWNLFLGGVIHPWKSIETNYYQVYGVQQQKERQA